MNLDDNELFEKNGAGFEGTNSLAYKYISDTPGQSIKNYKNQLKITKNDMNIDFIKKYGFKKAPSNKDTYVLPNYLELVELYGLPMRAGKWADIFVGLAYSIKKEKIGAFIKTNDRLAVFYGDGLIRNFKKYLDMGLKTLPKYEELEEESLTEVLKKSDPVEDWIADFIDSDAPQFKGKTKKERINMALGAYYAAQRNESVEEIEETQEIANDLKSSINEKVKPVLYAYLVGLYEGWIKNLANKLIREGWIDSSKRNELQKYFNKELQYIQNLEKRYNS